MSEEREKVIEISNLTKNYKMFARKRDRFVETVFPWINKHGTFTAMDNLNLDVYKGEVLGILGKNGAGKSTLLKMITGVVTPTSGEVKVKGKISSLLELGAAFNGELTGYENIYQHGQVMGLTDEQIKATEQDVIDFADIGEHLNQPVKTYSSGMFARLAFACAINVDPDVLIVDEVLSVGDMAFQLKCFKKFEQFKKKGKTILFVTHSVADVLRNCTRVIIIDKGRKIFDGDVKEGVERYKKMVVGGDKKLVDVKKERKANKIGADEKSEWKNLFNNNPNIIEYGTGLADVYDYGIFDENDKPLNVIENDRLVRFKSRIAFYADVNDPIFTMTIKDFKGNDMCGTNTLIEKHVTGKYKKGDKVEVCFEQLIPLCAGKYTVSFSCTHFDSTGKLEALSRKYDALLVEIVSMKDTVGTIRLDSNISFKKI